MIERLSEAYGKLLSALALVACALLFFMTLMICGDVLLRNTSIIPSVRNIAWSNEVSEATLYLVTMLTAPWTIFCRAAMIASACWRRSMALAISGAYARCVSRASSITTPALPTRS